MVDSVSLIATVYNVQKEKFPCHTSVRTNVKYTLQQIQYQTHMHVCTYMRVKLLYNFISGR